jgi:hypothetical protein
MPASMDNAVVSTFLSNICGGEQPQSQASPFQHVGYHSGGGSIRRLCPVRSWNLRHCPRPVRSSFKDLNSSILAVSVLTIDLSHRKPTGFVSVPCEWPQMQVRACCSVAVLSINAIAHVTQECPDLPILHSRTTVLILLVLLFRSFSQPRVIGSPTK